MARTSKKALGDLELIKDDLGSCMFVVTLDKRHAPTSKELAAMQAKGVDVGSILFPVVIRLTAKGNRLLLPTGKSFTEDDFRTLVFSYRDRAAKGYNSGTKDFYKECNALISEADRARLIVLEAIASHNICFPIIKEKFTGKVDLSKNNFNLAWAALVNDKKDKGYYGTAQSYEQALKRFTADMGDKVDFAQINHSFVKKWRSKMIADGLTETTAAIYLRTMRIVVKVCPKGKINEEASEIFKGLHLSATTRRTGEFLNADTMQSLYDFWLADEAKDADGKELFAPREKRALFRDLGYFLFTYLGNGMNVADMVNLKYNNYYFMDGGREFQFERKKTAESSKHNSDVYVPIIEPMRVLLERLANAPTIGGYVFPINKGGESAKTVDEHIHKTNANIRKALAKLFPLLSKGDIIPTATWARHSYATNLMHAEVPIDYIDRSMGHSDGKPISHYLSAYPFGKRMLYNGKLLPMMGEKGEMAAGITAEQLARLSPEKLAAIKAIIG